MEEVYEPKAVLEYAPTVEGKTAFAWTDSVGTIIKGTIDEESGEQTDVRDFLEWLTSQVNAGKCGSAAMEAAEAYLATFNEVGTGLPDVRFV